MKLSGDEMVIKSYLTYAVPLNHILHFIFMQIQRRRYYAAINASVVV